MILVLYAIGHDVNKLRGFPEFIQPFLNNIKRLIWFCTRTLVHLLTYIFTKLVNVKNAVTSVPRFYALLFRCFRSIFFVLTNIFTQIIFILVHFNGAHIHLDDNFSFAIVHQSNPRLIVLMTCPFLIMLGLTLCVHNSTRILLLIHFESSSTRR